MVSQAADRLDSMMRKVEGLLAKADDPAASPQEADSCRAMAERIMRKYKIEQEDLIARGDLKVDQFNVLFKEVPYARLNSEYQRTYRSLAIFAAHHADVLVIGKGIDANGNWVLEFIGYEEDIRYAEALFNGARLLFADRMEPKYNPDLSDEENVYRMRSAGMERRRVAEVMGWTKAGAKVTRLYKAACEARGEDPTLTGQGLSVADYRQAYADGFENRFWVRLDTARNAVDAEDGGIVLHDRAGRIKEAMYQRYPQLRPSTEPVKATNQPAKAPKPPKWTKADQRAWEKRNSATARAGRAAGGKAADEVNVNKATPKRRLSE